MDKPLANTNSQDSSRLGLGGNHHLPPYNIICGWPTPKCHFVSGLSSWSLEIPEIGTLATLEAHNFVCRPLIEVRSRAKL